MRPSCPLPRFGGVARHHPADAARGRARGRAGQRRGLLRARLAQAPARRARARVDAARRTARCGSSATRHLVRHDPEGCWVAEDETGMVGMATSFRREVLWCLTTYAVLPGRQGQGIGRQLMAAALHHGRACSRWMLSASPDAAAVRVYHQAGIRAAPADVPHRHRRPLRDPRRGEGARGVGVRHRADGLARPRDPRCRARRGPRADARRLAAAGVRQRRPARATPTSTSAAGSPCWRPRTGARRPGCSGRRSPTGRPRPRSGTSPAPTSGCWTSASRPG